TESDLPAVFDDSVTSEVTETPTTISMDLTQIEQDTFTTSAATSTDATIATTTTVVPTTTPSTTQPSTTQAPTTTFPQASAERRFMTVAGHDVDCDADSTLIKEGMWPWLVAEEFVEVCSEEVENPMTILGYQTHIC